MSKFHMKLAVAARPHMEQDSALELGVRLEQVPEPPNPAGVELVCRGSELVLSALTDERQPRS